MSILLLLNDKCFYFQILLCQGRISWIFYRIYLIKRRILPKFTHWISQNKKFVQLFNQSDEHFGVNRFLPKCANKRGEDQSFILLYCWERSPNPAERGSSILSPERTRNILLEFDSPDIAFSLMFETGMEKSYMNERISRRNFQQRPRRFLAFDCFHRPRFTLKKMFQENKVDGFKITLNKYIFFYWLLLSIASAVFVFGYSTILTTNS